MLCQLLDPADPMGRDWCLLAVQLEMSDKVPKLDGSSHDSTKKNCSQTARVLDEWEQNASSTIGNFKRKKNCKKKKNLTRFGVLIFSFFVPLGELISRIREMGREDAVKILQAGCSIYRIITLEESMSLPVLENDDSLILQQKSINGSAAAS